MRISRTLYFDHQATTPVDERVLQKMIPFFREKFGNPHASDHRVGWETSRAVAEAAHSIANLIGADADEIVFTSGATEANNLALLGLGRHETAGARRKILVSAVEHKSVLEVARILEQKLGYTVEHLPVDKDGRVSVSDLEDALDDDVLAVSIMAVNNEIGTIQDINGLAEAARKAGALFHCDAAQAPVAMNLESLARDVDFLSLSAHKMYGPAGIGILYIRRDLQDRIEPLIYGGGQQNGLRSGTLPAALCIGMGAAAEILVAQANEKERSILRKRRDTFLEKLLGLPWPVRLNGPRGENRHPGNVNVVFPGLSAHDILNALQPGLAASTGSACTSGIPEPSHVLKAIGLTGDEAEASIRFSLGFGTTDSDVEDAVGLIGQALERLSKIPSAHFE
ncbi:cysteine desulfurase [Methylocaldum sp. BRCS4]|uniref:cysteine desulfurase family protein n=1 Tax=Methylocaldum sp. 14B TaxID=1912213 RepID=UPI00098A5104|nr:cysteine desulfurase family protein [Methylocaldum sp. 14B]MVF23127.1 cysteine desulfurase [Methylocaldum sp. BRCS4]